MHAQIILPLLLAGTAFGQFVIDKFTSPDTGLNTAGNYHGCDDADGISCTYGSNGLTIKSTDTDYSFYTQFNNGGCQDITSLAGQYVHIKYSGDTQFSIALQQNNVFCSGDRAPYPETWDIVNAADYANGGEIYVPLDHFNIIKTRAIGFALKAFRNPAGSTTFSLLEIVTAVPSGFNIPTKKPTGLLYFSCTRPNSIAFGIDDGVPELAAKTMQIIKDAGIKVTFFTVGNALDDPSQPFTALYKQAAADGHQIAFHSYTHPKIESLNDVSAIDAEFTKSHESTLRNIGVDSRYFRAPYGTDGALTRQRLEATVPGTKVINWSVDVEDWLWALSDTPEKQTDAVKRDLSKGGNLVVMHYLYESTVNQFAGFIQLAKTKGLDIMRVDQCLQDPKAPPYP